MWVRVCLPASVILGIAAGLLAQRFLPAGSFWVDVIIGITAGIAFFCVVKVILSRGKQKP